ncbi:VOC family protein [Streptomyces sp. HC44]|uniref:VOC family protein n=1 Tax=Streptomyces scabichelini TaxID=2711217 RepID=A0A6G4V3N1_9ACTN|nr:VOC family protein [Streptomyces scabichelini]NGO08480.1 VOC family protein [Streptomyces scabichelini]
MADSAESTPAAASAGSSAGSSAGFEEGVPCWIDAQLSDVEAGKRFYGELFGWTFGVGYGSSTWAYSEERAVAALTPKRDGRMPTVWTVFFATPDAAGLGERIRAAGGQVITEPVPLDPYGTMALAADQEGAVFGLWEGDEHAGFGRRHMPGTFGWVELYARDTKLADDFYGDLFHDTLFGPDAAPDFGRAPVSDVFPAEMPPHFLVHFSVEDCGAALDTVTRLGGRIQAPPFETSYGIVAVVTDNQGASFAMLQR